MNRICRKCGVEKPIEEFERRKGRNYGFTCKECVKEFHKNYRLNHPELKEKQSQYRLSHKADDNRRCREYRKRHRDEIAIRYKTTYRKRILKWQREYFLKNKEHIYSRTRMYLLRNPEKVRIYNNRYLVKMRREITDSYIVKNVSTNYDIPCAIIRKYPDLINSYREMYKVRNLLKQIKNENIKTS